MDLMNSLETQTKIVYAARVYPSEQYTWKVDKEELKQDVQKLTEDGYKFDNGIEMKETESDKVIYIYKPIKTIKLDVKGDVIKK